MSHIACIPMATLYLPVHTPFNAIHPIPIFLVPVLFLVYSCSSEDNAENVISLEEPAQSVINADHVTDEVEFRLRRSIAATEDLIYWYAENNWNTEELERQLLEKIDQLITLYLENGWDMSEIEVKLANLERLLESL